MDMVVLQEFLLWCSVINIGVMLLSFIMIWSMNDFICRMHGWFMKMPPEEIRPQLYSILGHYKIITFFFNIIPYIALVIMNAP